MLGIEQSFAGVDPHCKALAADGDTLYYISASNLVVSSAHAVARIHHFGNTLSCVAGHSGRAALGDVAGTATIVDGDTRTAHLGAKVLDCCFLGRSFAAFCTFDCVFIINCQTLEKFALGVDFTISAVASVGGKLLVGTNLGVLHLYGFDGSAAAHIGQVDAHSDCIRNIRAHGSLVATCSQDSNVKVWSCEGGSIALVQTLNGHSDWVNGVCWHGGRLYSASSDKTVRVWEKGEFYVCSDIIGAAPELLSVEFLGGRLVVQARSGGIDKVGSDGAHEYFLSGHQGEVVDLDWNRNLLLSCSSDRTTRLFYGGCECARAQIHGFPMTSARFMPGPRLRFISSGQETILRIYEGTQAFFASCESLKSPAPGGDFLDFYADRDSYAKSAFLSELNLTNEIGTDPGHEGLSENALCSSVFRECQKIYGHYFEIKSIAVGRSLVLSCNRSAARKFAGLFVWDLQGNRLQYIEEHDLDIQKIAISPSQAFAATAGRDRLVCLYSIEGSTLSTARRFHSHERIVWDCGFSRDSRRLATCSRDGRIVLYDTASMSVTKVADFGCEVTAVSFSPRADVLIAGTGGGEVLCLDYELNVLDRIRAVGRRVNVARFDESGRVVAVGGADGLVRILGLPQSV